MFSKLLTVLLLIGFVVALSYIVISLSARVHNIRLVTQRATTIATVAQVTTLRLAITRAVVGGIADLTAAGMVAATKLVLTCVII